jgi:hypothetical protein
LISAWNAWKRKTDGIGAHMRYRFACRGDVLKVIQFVNRMAAVNNITGFQAGYRRHSEPLPGQLHRRITEPKK